MDGLLRMISCAWVDRPLTSGGELTFDLRVISCAWVDGPLTGGGELEQRFGLPDHDSRARNSDARLRNIDSACNSYSPLPNSDSWA